MSRLAMFTPGPSFSALEDGTVMFSYQVDASNMIGPRPAMGHDKMKHPEAWRAFMEANSDTELAKVELATMPAPEPEKRRPGRPKKAA